MSLKLKPCRMNDFEELRTVLLADPGVIEDGLQLIPVSQGADSLDQEFLGVDSAETFVIISANHEPADGHLERALAYYDLTRPNLSWIASEHRKEIRANPDLSPRLFLISPTFTDPVKRIAKYVDLELILKEYQAFEDGHGEKGIVITEWAFEKETEDLSILALDKKLDRMQNARIKELFHAILSRLQERGVETKPVDDQWLSFWYKGRRFMYLRRKHTSFSGTILSPNGTWHGLRNIESTSDWDMTYYDEVAQVLQ